MRTERDSQYRGSGIGGKGVLPKHPCTHPIGSIFRLRVYAQRAERGEKLHHPKDSKVVRLAPRKDLEAWLNEFKTPRDLAEPERKRKYMRMWNSKKSKS